MEPNPTWDLVRTRSGNKPGPRRLPVEHVWNALEKVMEEKTTVSSTMAKFPKRRRMQNKIVDQAREEINWMLSLTDAEVVSLTYDDVSKRLTPQGWKEALKKRKRWKELQWRDLFQEVTLLLPRKKNGECYSSATIRPFVREYMYNIHWPDLPPRFINKRRAWIRCAGDSFARYQAARFEDRR